MPHISTIGVCAGHLVNARPASALCVSFDLEGPPARSRPSPSWVDCFTSIGVLPDGLYFCALQGTPTGRCAAIGRSLSPVRHPTRVATRYPLLTSNDGTPPLPYFQAPYRRAVAVPEVAGIEAGASGGGSGHGLHGLRHLAVEALGSADSNFFRAANCSASWPRPNEKPTKSVTSAGRGVSQKRIRNPKR